MLISNMTIAFQNSSPKIPKQGIFGSKFRHFCFSAEFCNQTNSRALISNMTLLFSNSSPKIPKAGNFGPEFRHFCFFLKFCKQTNLRVSISDLTIVFLKFFPKKTQIRHFESKILKQGIFGPKFRHFHFCTKFCNKTNSKVSISNMTIAV